MIKVMDKINNHFIPIHNLPEYDEFEIVVDGIAGNFTETYIAGMYVIIKHSYLNDGIYKISDVTSTKLTVEETLSPENTGRSIIVVASTPPADFVDIADQIDAYKESIGITSEQQGERSVKYENGGSWEQSFSNKLDEYRKLFNDIEEKFRINCQEVDCSRW